MLMETRWALASFKATSCIMVQECRYASDSECPLPFSIKKGSGSLSLVCEEQNQSCCLKRLHSYPPRTQWQDEPKDCMTFTAMPSRWIFFIWVQTKRPEIISFYLVTDFKSALSISFIAFQCLQCEVKWLHKDAWFMIKSGTTFTSIELN